MFLGIDIGSSSTKVAVLNDKKELAGVSVINLGTGTNAFEEVIADALAQANATKDDIQYTIATGYGRVNFQDADKQITEITCHARA